MQFFFASAASSWGTFTGPIWDGGGAGSLPAGALVLHLYPPFWVILVGLIGMQMVLGRLEPVLQSNPLPWAPGLLPLRPFDGAPPLTAAWTLSHEILFYLIFGLCIYLGRAGLLIFALWMLFCLMALFWWRSGLPGHVPSVTEQPAVRDRPDRGRSVRQGHGGDRSADPDGGSRSLRCDHGVAPVLVTRGRSFSTVSPLAS